MNVLIVEDNEQNLYLEEFLLRAHGHTSESAGNGACGIEKAKTLAFDAILLDIQLPDMDGYEVARRIVSLPGWRPVPIVAVTSYAMPGDRSKALAAGCSGYVEKPINPDTFVAQIEGLTMPGGTQE